MDNRTYSHHVAVLGERLERTRLLRDIPQAELARQAGISPRTLRRLESGEGGSLESFIRLLIALDLDTNLIGVVPDHKVRPMERTRAAKTERMRASRSTNSSNQSAEQHGAASLRTAKQKSESKSNWQWGDEKRIDEKRGEKKP